MKQRNRILRNLKINYKASKVWFSQVERLIIIVEREESEKKFNDQISQLKSKLEKMKEDRKNLLKKHEDELNVRKNESILTVFPIHNVKYSGK